ncbi:hypothetical protein M2169_003705 [Streptomyces sp. MJP52]|nr:hypothetical protein [Streptomyces sp. MJP52]
MVAPAARRVRRAVGPVCGNRYDARMVLHDVSEKTPGAQLLVARLHVDLCRLNSALCPR